jgi:glycosyltransferase involved in cell wall biosynthesis
VETSATREAVEAIGAPIRDLRLIPMGTDVTAVADPERVAVWRTNHRRDDGPLVAFVGRLIDWKGVDDLLDAAALARSELPGLRVVIAGSGPLREHLERRVDELKLTERVHFAGWLDRDEVTALQAAADIVAVPSRTAADGSREAQGLSVVEAMALGKAVIATKTGGIPDAITNGENGMLVPEADPAALAKGLVTLAGDPELVARLGAAAKITAQRYSWPASASRFIEVFESVVRKA